MPRLPLPEKSVSYSSDNFKRLYDQVRSNPESAKLIADEIERSPRNALEYAFDLTDQQREAFEMRGDDDLRERARVLIVELRKEVPGPLEFPTSNSKKKKHKHHKKGSEEPHMDGINC